MAKDNDQTSDKKSGSRTAIWVVIIIVIVLATAGAAFYFFYWRRRHPSNANGEDIRVGDAVVMTFTATSTSLCATTADPHAYDAYGVVTNITNDQATVFWTAMYDKNDDKCAWVRGNQKGVSGWEAQWMGVGTTSPTSSGTELKTVVPVANLGKLGPSNY